MCLATTKALTQEYYDKIKHKKEVKAYKVVIVGHNVLYNETAIYSLMRSHIWRPGINVAVVVRRFLNDPPKMLRIGLHNRKKLKDKRMIDVHAGIHVYTSKTIAKQIAARFNDRSLMTVYCNPEDLIAADRLINNQAVFTKVRLTTREYNRLIKTRGNRKVYV